MTVSNIKVKVVRRPSVKIKMLTAFPASIRGTGGISVEKSGSEYVISPDAGVLGDVTGPGVGASVAGQIAVFADGNHIEGSGVPSNSLGLLFDTRAAVQAANIPLGHDTLRTGGYATAGDGGGALYKRGSLPSHSGYIQSADGAYWVIAETELNPIMFGADPTGAADSYTALQAALDCTVATRIRLPGSFKTNTGLNITRTLELIGSGTDWTENALAVSQIRSNALIDILKIIGADNVRLVNFGVHGDGGRAGQNVRGIVVGFGGVSVSDGGISNGSANFTSASAGFTSADVGKNIRVTGAGLGGSDLVTSISSRTNSTTVVLGSAASTTVSGASAYWVDLPSNVTIQGVSTNSIHKYGVHVENCANFHMSGHGEVKGEYAALRRENRLYSDQGDDMVSDTQFEVTQATGIGFHHLSGGGLKSNSCKALGGQYGYFADWTLGISANLLIEGWSLEDQSGAAIRINPEKGFVRANIVGNTALAGQFLLVDSGSTGAMDNLVVSGNTAQGRAASPLIQIGKASKFIIADNILDGQSVSTVGVSVAASAVDGLVLDNEIKNCTADVSNSSTSTFVRKFDSTGVVLDHQITANKAGRSGRFVNSTDTGLVEVAAFEGDRATPASADAAFNPYRLSNAAGTQFEFSRDTWGASVVTAGSEVGYRQWAVAVSGTLTQKLFLNGSQLSPIAANGLVLGQSTLGFSGLYLAGATSGDTLLKATSVASGTITLPAGTDTLIGKATTDTLTNKTFDTAGAGNSLSINGVAVTANTGTGAVARAASPTFTGTLTAAALSLSGNINMTGNTGAFGPGGAGATGVNFILDGASGSAAPAYFQFSIASVSKWQFGIQTGVGNLDLSYYRGGSSVYALRISGTDDTVTVGATTASTSSASGALVVSGGAGVAGAVNSNASVAAHKATAIPAGGTAGAGLLVSSTANFGVFFGSGAPTLSAAKGSLYMRSDGSSTSTRMYVNTDGATTWTNVTTAA